jgi:hypothetical protein
VLGQHSERKMSWGVVFFPGILWVFKDFEIGGAPPPQVVTASTVGALVLFGLLGLNLLAGLTVPIVSALRRQPFGVRFLGAVQALDVCVRRPRSDAPSAIAHHRRSWRMRAASPCGGAP